MSVSLRSVIEKEIELIQVTLDNLAQRRADGLLTERNLITLWKHQIQRLQAALESKK